MSECEHDFQDYVDDADSACISWCPVCRIKECDVLRADVAQLKAALSDRDKAVELYRKQTTEALEKIENMKADLILAQAELYEWRHR